MYCFEKGILPTGLEPRQLLSQFIKKETPNIWITTGGYLYSVL